MNRKLRPLSSSGRAAGTRPHQHDALPRDVGRGVPLRAWPEKWYTGRPGFVWQQSICWSSATGDIVYLGNRPNSLTHQLRLRGFTETLEKAGITPQVIDNPHGCSSIDIGCALSRKLFANGCSANCDLRLDRFHGARRIAGSRRIRHLCPRGYFPARL